MYTCTEEQALSQYFENRRKSQERKEESKPTIVTRHIVEIENPKPPSKTINITVNINLVQDEDD